MATTAQLLTELTTDIENAYISIGNKNGVIPQHKNMDNLSTSIDSIDIIGKLPYMLDGSLTSLTAEDFANITSIRAFAFYTCDDLESITIPSTITQIGNNAFGACTSLTGITIPDSITILNNGMFNGCISLKNLYLPANMVMNPNIPYPEFFTNCPLENFSMSASISAYISDRSHIKNAIINGGNMLNTYPFYQCTTLETAQLASTITLILDNAFNGCTNLTTLIMEGSTPPTLRNGVFDNTPNLTIYVPPDALNTYLNFAGWSNYANKIVANPN